MDCGVERSRNRQSLLGAEVTHVGRTVLSPLIPNDREWPFPVQEIRGDGSEIRIYGRSAVDLWVPLSEIKGNGRAITRCMG